MQILNAQSDDLARACAGDCQRIGQQPELMIERVGGGDEFAHLVVRENNVARLLRIRQTGEPDFPGVPVWMRSSWARSAAARRTGRAKPIDSGRRHRAQQAVAPLLQLGAVSAATAWPATRW